MPRHGRGHPAAGLLRPARRPSRPARFQGRLTAQTDRSRSRAHKLRYESDGPIFVLSLKDAAGGIVQNLHIGGGGSATHRIDTPGTYSLQVSGSERGASGWTGPVSRPAKHFHRDERPPPMIRTLRAAALALPLALAATALVHAHGDGAPSAIDTTGLEPLGENDRDKNPYVGNAKAVEIGASATTRTAPAATASTPSPAAWPGPARTRQDGGLRHLFPHPRARRAQRDGRYRMPPFADILSQEAIWAIRTYIESEADKDPAIAAKIN